MEGTFARLGLEPDALLEELRTWARENGMAATFRVERDRGIFRVHVIFESKPDVELSVPVSYVAAADPTIARVVCRHLWGFARNQGLTT